MSSLRSRLDICLSKLDTHSFTTSNQLPLPSAQYSGLGSSADPIIDTYVRYRVVFLMFFAKCKIAQQLCIQTFYMLFFLRPKKFDPVIVAEKPLRSPLSLSSTLVDREEA